MVLTPTAPSLLTTQCKILFFGKSDVPLSMEGIARECSCTRRAEIRQNHGTDTVILRTPLTPPPQADAVATDTPGLLLSLKIADCQNFAVYAPRPHVIGLIHAGWRGMNAHIISLFYDTLKREWGIHPYETVVWAGPSLCKRCAEFTDPQRELPQIDPRFFHGRHVDLQRAAIEEFLHLGVPMTKIERHSDCTCCQREKYWTYRGGDREAVLQGKENILAATLRSE